MLKNILLFIPFVFLIGCSPSGTVFDDNGYGDDYISSIPTDIVPNPSVARVPHTNSSIPMIAILVNYNNISISSDDYTWGQKLFGTNEGQLNHYFTEASNNNFQFTKVLETAGTTNDGIISVTLNEDHPNTDIDQNREQDPYTGEITPSFEEAAYPDLKNALIAADPFIDYQSYDSDGNNHITPDELLLTFIIAGYEDSYELNGHATNGIWAHQFCMTDSTNIATLDNVSLMGCQNGGNFSLFGELHDSDNNYTHDATIGIIAHELGHSAFALPDLYNPTDDRGGIGYFGLMGSGTWAQKDYYEFPGETPVHFSAWSKVYNGWVTPTEPSNTIAVLNETASNTYNVIKIPISANHYYLLENRNNSGYDRGLYSLDDYPSTFDGGIAIWHINENKLTDEHFFYNSVNSTTSDKGVDVVEAAYPRIDYYSYAAGSEKALFYSPNVDHFGDKITDISSRGPQMTLNIH